MPEYIESAKMAEVIHRYFVGYRVEDMIRNIRKEAAADVAPVVHGRWVNRFNASVYECSECGTIGLPCWKGCPECLARMDGE